MSISHVKYLLLGGGSAAAGCAEAIRAMEGSGGGGGGGNGAGEMMLVSAESSRPYYRPPLSKAYLRREIGQSDLFVHPASWYADHRITLRTATRALALDVAKRSVVLSDSSEIYFDRLLLATGANAKPLGFGGNLPGVMYLRSIEECDRIHHAADVALTSGRGKVVVIGSALIAAEIAASLALRKPVAGRTLDVTLLCTKSHLFEGLAGENIGRAAARTLENLGVKVVVAALNPPAVEGDGRVQRVLTSEGPLPCDFVVVGEGWLPNKDLLRGTNIAAEKAILTDEHGRTNVEGIYAAGECAAMFDPVFRKHRILDHWDVTVARGALVGTNMVGGQTPQTPWPGITTHHAHLGPTEITVLGEPRFTDRRIVRDEGPNGLLELGITRQNTLCSAATLAWKGPPSTLKSLIRNQLPITDRESRLRDPNLPL